MPFFKKKDKTSTNEPHAPSFAGPTDLRPELQGDASHSNFSNAALSSNNNDRDSNLSTADTRVNHQRDSNGNQQTVVTTTTTTTTTTVTSDGRVITEQHETPASELPVNSSPPPRTPDIQAQQQPVQASTTEYSAPNIPDRNSRRIPAAQGDFVPSPILPQGQSELFLPQTQSQPPLPGNTNSGANTAAQPNYAQSQPPLPDHTSQTTNTATAQPNFSRPGGRRENIKQGIVGLHGVGDGLRGAINVKAGELLGDDPETLARNKEIRDKGMRDVRGSTLLQRIRDGHGDDEHRRKLQRRSGNVDAVDDNRARNF